MKVRRIRPGEHEQVAGWLAEERNNRWLDFGGGRRVVDALALKVMCQRDLHLIRVFTDDDEDRPVGIVGLSDVDERSRTATAWVVLGEKEYGRKDLTIRAVDQILRIGFEDLGLQSVFAWTVEINRGGRRLLERFDFRFIGRKRKCHRIRGKLYDRLLYDLLADEYEGYDDEWKRRPGLATTRGSGSTGEIETVDASTMTERPDTKTIEQGVS